MVRYKFYIVVQSRDYKETYLLKDILTLLNRDKILANSYFRMLSIYYLAISSDSILELIDKVLEERKDLCINDLRATLKVDKQELGRKIGLKSSRLQNFKTLFLNGKIEDINITEDEINSAREFLGLDSEGLL